MSKQSKIGHIQFLKPILDPKNWLNFPENSFCFRKLNWENNFYKYFIFDSFLQKPVKMFPIVDGSDLSRVTREIIESFKEVHLEAKIYGILMESL